MAQVDTSFTKPLTTEGDSLARWKRTVRRMHRRPRIVTRSRFQAQARDRAYQQKIKSLNQEKAQLEKRILEQERKAALDAEEKSTYHQMKQAKKEVFKMLSPSLGNIDVDSPQIATGLAVLPWAIIALALITREG